MFMAVALFMAVLLPEPGAGAVSVRAGPWFCIPVHPSATGEGCLMMWALKYVSG